MLLDARAQQSGAHVRLGGGGEARDRHLVHGGGAHTLAADLQEHSVRRRPGEGRIVPAHSARLLTRLVSLHSDQSR